MTGEPDSTRSGLPARFRKADPGERRALVGERTGNAAAFGAEPELLELADVMVESSIGYLALPVGIAAGFLVDGAVIDVPLATEEPSVVAAAGYGAALIRRGGGFATTAGNPVTTGQIFVIPPESSPDAAEWAAAAAERLAAATELLTAEAAPHLERMSARGGGWRGVNVSTLRDPAAVRLEFDIDTRDAMGANLVNTVAEQLRPTVERLTGGEVLMAILTNAAPARVCTAQCVIPAPLLARAGRSGNEIARRIALASAVAHEDEGRAVTHNKGIMNGVSALAAATGNDTRAVEAGAHWYAARSGRYRPLSAFSLEGDSLVGRIELPLALGTVGGAAGIHPATRAALRLLGDPDSALLGRIAAAVGLAQNFSALYALTSEGIQRGHMGLHANRVAYAAGARGAELAAVAQRLRDRGEYSTDAAREELARMRASAGAPGADGGEPDRNGEVR